MLLLLSHAKLSSAKPQTEPEDRDWSSHAFSAEKDRYQFFFNFPALRLRRNAQRSKAHVKSQDIFCIELY